MADDGICMTRTADAMKELYEKDQVFGIIGNVGTPTAVVAAPYALERRMLFFGAFTGANVLRNDPPDRYVSNRIQVRPLFASKNDPPYGAATCVAEPPIAAQTRSF